MHLKLEKNNWDKLHFVIGNKQKDYDYINNEKINIFIYGYPFNASTNSWISANNVYQLYLSKKLDFINDIDGIYAIIILDRIKNECFVIIDRYGVYSLFYTNNQKHLILADDISEIIPYLPNIKLNHKSIIEYLHMRLKLGNKTHIEDIYEFESSTIYRINSQLELTETIYWTFLGKSQKDKIEAEEFRKLFNAHIMTAMNLAGKISLPLTGGYDTRTILSASIPKKESIHCYTHGVRNADDVKIAQKICNHFNIKHNLYELDEAWIKNIPSMLENKSAIFNGLIPSLTFLHVISSYEKEEDEGELLIPGLFGNEILRCMLGNKVVNAKSLDDVASLIMVQYIIAEHFFEEYSSKDIRNLMYESIKDELLKAENVTDPVNLSEFFVFRSYCSNWGSNSLKSMGKYFKVFPAFLHKDLLQQIPLLALTEKTSAAMQKYIITKNDSYLAAIPMDTGKTITGNLTSLLFYRYLKLGLNKISKKIFRGYNLFTPPNIADYPNWLRKYHKEFVLEVLSYEKMVTNELFNKERLQKGINSFLNGNDSLTLFILHLISLEMWVKTIFKGK